LANFSIIPILDILIKNDSFQASLCKDFSHCCWLEDTKVTMASREGAAAERQKRIVNLLLGNINAHFVLAEASPFVGASNPLEASSVEHSLFHCLMNGNHDLINAAMRHKEAKKRVDRLRQEVQSIRPRCRMTAVTTSAPQKNDGGAKLVNTNDRESLPLAANLKTSDGLKTFTSIDSIHGTESSSVSVENFGTLEQDPASTCDAKRVPQSVGSERGLKRKGHALLSEETVANNERKTGKAEETEAVFAQVEHWNRMLNQRVGVGSAYMPKRSSKPRVCIPKPPSKPTAPA